MHMTEQCNTLPYRSEDSLTIVGRPKGADVVGIHQFPPAPPRRPHSPRQVANTSSSDPGVLVEKGDRYRDIPKRYCRLRACLRWIVSQLLTPLNILGVILSGSEVEARSDGNRRLRVPHWQSGIYDNIKAWGHTARLGKIKM